MEINISKDGGAGCTSFEYSMQETGIHRFVIAKYDFYAKLHFHHHSIFLFLYQHDYLYTKYRKLIKPRASGSGSQQPKEGSIDPEIIDHFSKLEDTDIAFVFSNIREAKGNGKKLIINDFYKSFLFHK